MCRHRRWTLRRRLSAQWTSSGYLMLGGIKWAVLVTEADGRPTGQLESDWTEPVCFSCVCLCCVCFTCVFVLCVFVLCVCRGRRLWVSAECEQQASVSAAFHINETTVTLSSAPLCWWEAHRHSEPLRTSQNLSEPRQFVQLVSLLTCLQLFRIIDSSFQSPSHFFFSSGRICCLSVRQTKQEICGPCHLGFMEKW